MCQLFFSINQLVSKMSKYNKCSLQVPKAQSDIQVFKLLILSDHHSKDLRVFKLKLHEIKKSSRALLLRDYNQDKT